MVMALLALVRGVWCDMTSYVWHGDGDMVAL